MMCVIMIELHMIKLHLSIHPRCIKPRLLAHHSPHLHLHDSIRFVHLGRFSQDQRIHIVQSKHEHEIPKG